MRRATGQELKTSVAGHSQQAGTCQRKLASNPLLLLIPANSILGPKGKAKVVIIQGYLPGALSRKEKYEESLED